MRKTKYINDFDYNKMIRDFETNSRHEEHLKKIRKRWATESKKYQETIEHMKELREETYQKKNNDLVKKLKKKEKLLITCLENKEKDKMKDKQRAITIMLEREKAARDNVEKYKEKMEKERINFELEIQEKSKNTYFY